MGAAHTAKFVYVPGKSDLPDFFRADARSRKEDVASILQEMMYGLRTQLWVQENKGDKAFFTPLLSSSSERVVQATACDGTAIATSMPGCFVFRRCIVKRETSCLATLVFLLVSLPLMVAQDPQTQPSPALPSSILGPQLVAWSQLQKPQPAPQPLPPPDRPITQPDQQQPSPPAQQQPPATLTLMGTIVKDGTRYVLKVSSNSAYQLADQDKVKEFEGKQVKIAGTLDADGKVLHITSIELVS
jgi:hypothetical protein